MSAFASQVLLLIQHFSAILSVVGERAVPVATLALKFLDAADPVLFKIVPSIQPFIEAVQVALTFIVNHGPSDGANAADAIKLLGSVDSLAPKLTAAAATPVLTSAVSESA
jgi:hypothetical protein